MINPQVALEACQASYARFTFAMHGVEVLHMTHDDVDLLAFRGTSDARDAIRDMRALPWPSPLGMVHSGFFKGVDAIWGDLVPIIANGRPTAFVGHSKGGSEATIAAGAAVQLGHMPMALVTFGAPRCGFSKLTKILRPVPSARFKNADDAVTSHPWPLWGYRHHCSAIQIGDQGRYSSHPLAAYEKSLKKWLALNPWVRETSS